MKRWRVQGVDRISGQERIVFVDATDERDAIRQANDLGVMVERVFPDDPAPAARPGVAERIKASAAEAARTAAEVNAQRRQDAERQRAYKVSQGQHVQPVKIGTGGGVGLYLNITLGVASGIILAGVVMWILSFFLLAVVAGAIAEAGRGSGFIW